MGTVKYFSVNYVSKNKIKSRGENILHGPILCSNLMDVKPNNKILKIKIRNWTSKAAQNPQSN